MKQKFSFLCGTFEKYSYIYAVKFDQHPWHYFDEDDSIISRHDCLPLETHAFVSTLRKISTLQMFLDEEKSKNYYINGKFTFKNKELKTYMELANVNPSPTQPKLQHKDTKNLIFIAGQTNPLLFIQEFEKCSDLKSDKDKMFKIRNFVDDVHRVEFSELFFTSDWRTVKTAFLKKYSSLFLENKQRNLNIDFNEESTLRSFVERKLSGLGTYTTLPFFNRMEIVLNDLPIEISTLFLLNEKLTSSKTEILEFCDSIQDIVEAMQGTMEKEPNVQQNDEDQCLNRMEIFNYNDTDTDTEPESMSVNDSLGASRGVGSTRRGRCRGRGLSSGKVAKKSRSTSSTTSTEKLTAIMEDSDSESYSFLGKMSPSSVSSWSDIGKR